MNRLHCTMMALVAVIGSALATTLEPVTLEDQIDGAAVIFRARADAVHAEIEPIDQGRRIVTTVRFTPLAVMKGEVSEPVALRFLGGKVGDLELHVDGMPEFAVGGEYVLFVAEGNNRACPVVGWTQGSLPVDAATATVRVPPAVAVDLRPRVAAARSASGDADEGERLSVAVFEAALRERIQEAREK